MSNTAKLTKPWAKGQSGNPAGRPAVPEHLRGIFSLTQGETTKLISKFARMSFEELHVFLQTPGNATLDMAIASIFRQSIKKGDYQRLAFLLDRAIGRVRDVVEDDEEQNEREELGKLSMKELLTLVKENLPGLE